MSETNKTAFPSIIDWLYFKGYFCLHKLQYGLDRGLTVEQLTLCRKLTQGARKLRTLAHKHYP